MGEVLRLVLAWPPAAPSSAPKAFPVMLGGSAGDPGTLGKRRSISEEALSCLGPGGLEKYVEFPNLAFRNRFV